MKSLKQDPNKSNFNFQSFSFAPADPQKHRIYSYKSQQVRQGMEDESKPLKTQTKFYNNNIFHSTHKYQVPIRDYSRVEREVPSYHQFYNTTSKFTKPYGELTKYSDSVQKNGALLRRGPCDIPFHLNLPKQTSHNYLRSKKGTMRQSRLQPKRSENIRKREDDSGLFEKTVQTQCLIFKKVFAKERTKKKDAVDLNNSLNRLLAVEMIEDRLQVKLSSRLKTDHL